jgi:hypothetical protein
MTFSNLSAQEKRKHLLSHARHEIEEWRRFQANTKDPTQKLFAQNQINHHLNTLKE